MNKRIPRGLAVGIFVAAASAGIGVAASAGTGATSSDPAGAGGADAPAISAPASPAQCREAMSQLNLYRTQQNTAGRNGDQTSYWVYEGMQVSIRDWMVEHGC